MSLGLLLPLHAAAQTPIESALDRISHHTPAALAAMPADFERDWHSPDPRTRLGAVRTLAVYAVFERAALELAQPHLDAGAALAREAGDDGTLSLLVFLQGIAAFLALPAPEGPARRDELMAQADALSLRAVDPTARCLALYLQGRARKHAVAEARWMQSFLDALALPGAAPACRSWVTAEMNKANGQRITRDNHAMLDTALAEVASALEATPATRYPTVAGHLLLARGLIYERAGRLGEVEAPLRRALELARGTGDRNLEVAVLDGMEYLYVAMDRPRDVLAVLKQSAAVLNPGSTVDQALRALRAAEMHARLSPPEATAALAALKEAQQLLAGRPEDRLTRRATEVASYVYERTGDLPAALAQARLLREVTERQIAQGHARQLADLQVQFDVKQRALEGERLRVSVDALTERRNLLTVGLVLAALGLLALGFLLRTQMLQRRHVARLYGQLEQLNASRSEFLAAACHDLRQPAQSLALLAEVAHGRGGAGPREVENIRHHSDLMGDMLSSLLDMAQLERADLTVNEGPVSLDALFDDAARQFQPVAARKGLTLAAPHTGLWVRSDAQLLRRVLFNLLSNACKYTDHGTVALAAAAAPDAQVAVTVTDTGRGIPAARIADMLRPYTRLDHGAAEPGLGIGLSVVQRAVQRLGHGLAIDSAMGRGTTVRLSLPVCEAPAAAGDAAAAGAAPATDTTASPPAAHRALVAVVDDQPEILATLAELVAQWGHEAVTATDEAGLLARLQGRRPDMLLLDLNIGADSGLALATRLMQQQPGWASVACVLFTGTVSADVETQARAQGLQVLFKPVRPSVLKRTIDRTLAGPRADPQTNPH